MDIERTLETQRLKLLRIVAGLVLIVGVLAVGPVSRRFSDWTLGFVGALLPRIEAASRYMVITQACLMVDHCGLDVDRSQISMPIAPEWGADDADLSLAACRQRLRALRAVLSNVPRHALRLLRQIAKQNQRITNACQTFFNPCRSASISEWRQAERRIERPPDKSVASWSPSRI